MGSLEQLPFAGRDHHIFDRNGYSRFGCVMIAHIFEPIGKDDSCLIPGQPIAQIDQVRQLLLFHDSIHFFKRNH